LLDIFWFMSPTNSTLLDLVGASVEDALLHFRAMRDANSSLLGLPCTSLVAASFQLCAMRNTH
jgi:hypothetical protein